MDWKLLQNIYYEDNGTWRDIYIHNTTKLDWKKWINLVNENYRLEFYNGLTGRTEYKIKFKIIHDYWDGKHNTGSSTKIEIGSIDINCHFFTEEEIENDIDPKQVKNIEDHNLLISYLLLIESTLNKKVILTPENAPDFKLIECENGKIKFSNLNNMGT